MENGALLRGMAYSAGSVEVQTDARVLGPQKSESPLYLQNKVLVPATEFPVTLGRSISLEPGESEVILPEGYERWIVKTGAVLGIGAGEYFVHDLFLEPQAELAIANDKGSIQMHVLGSLNCKGDISKAAADASNVRIIYWGTGSANIECDLPGVHIVAPNGHIRVADGLSVGKLVGESVEVGVGARVVNSAYQAFTSGPAGTLLSELSDSEKTASCQRVKSSLFTDEYRDAVCRLSGHVSILQEKPSTTAAARATCSIAYDECLAADPCEALDERVSEDCDVTLAERDQCLSEYIESALSEYASLEPCSDTTLYDTLVYQSNPVPVPSVCARYFSCLEGDL